MAAPSAAPRPPIPAAPRPYAWVQIVADPFHPARRQAVGIDGPGPIGGLVPPFTASPIVVFRNGTPVLRRDWHQPVAAGDVIAIVALPQGGGDDKDPLGVLLQIGLAVIAPGIGEAVAWSLVDALTLDIVGFKIVAGLVSGAVGLLGSALINAMLPPQRAPQAAGPGQNYAAASPTYSLQAQGNMARLDGAIPEQFGRMKCFPDFAAQPYLEYAGNEQYLYMLLCIGRGEYEVEGVFIEDTALSSFEDVETEIVAPNVPPSLFPVNVTTSTEVSGQEAENGVALGPFTANAAGTTANRLAIDVLAPRGLYEVNVTTGGLNSKSIFFTVQARQIDDGGSPLGSWVTLGTETLTAATLTPQRRSYSYGVPTAGRYEVKLARTNADDTGTTVGHTLDWVGLRAYLIDSTDFGDCTLLAVRARATNQLSSASSRKIAVIATRKLPIWDGEAWSVNNETTRSIAWALAYMAKAAGFPDARLDLAGLLALDAVWAARGDTLNIRIDSVGTFWDLLTRAAQAGRARPYLQGGILYFWRDAAAATPVALFSPRNIVRGSFSLEFLTPTEDTADAVTVSYWDETVWASRPVTAYLPGSTAAKPAKTELWGITDREQAYREAMYAAAVNRYRRTVIRFAAEMEGFIPAFGDLIAVAHDMPAWGQGGEVVAWDGGSLTATLSEPPTWTPAATHYIGLRTRAGAVSGPYVVTAGATDLEVVLAEDPELADAAFAFQTGSGEERTHYAFGAGETWRQPARVVAIKPRDLLTVDIEAINEDASVHTADEGITAPAVTYSALGTLFTAPVVAGLVAHSMADDADKMVLSWLPAPGADHYLIEQSNGDDTWTRTGDTSASHYTATVLYGASTLVRVAGVGLVRGPWVTVSYATMTADYMWTSDAAAMWSSDSTLMWS